jgi:hypothetical protein
MSTAEIETAQPVSFPKEKCCVNVCHYFFIGIQKLFVDNKTLLLTTHSVHTAISFSLLHPHTINIFIYDDDDDDDGINSSTRSIHPSINSIMIMSLSTNIIYIINFAICRRSTTTTTTAIHLHIYIYIYIP